MVAADEPQAALLGRDVLVGGGTAADAAVAMAFTMAVTLPTQVSLGSAGSCLVYDHGQKMVDAVDFVPQPTASANPSSLVPALPRGLFLLHANYGRTRWDQLLAPVQALAQRGVPASRAFVRQLEPVAASLADPAARSLYLRPDGRPLAEGDLVRNPQLAIVLGRMASRGVGELYNGTWSQEFVAAAQQIGAGITIDDMRRITPSVRKPLGVNYGHEVAYFSPPPAMLGTMQSQSWSELAGNDAYKDASKGERPRLIADTLARAYWPAQGSAVAPGAGAVAVDTDGNAVACQFTLNGAFGTGRMVPGFGFFLAAGQPDAGAAVGPMIAINPNSNEFRFAAVASGGVAGAKMVLRTALATLLGEAALPDAVAAEAKIDGPDRIEAARCLSGSPDIKRCVAATDPRGFGLAQAMAGQ